MDFLYVQSDQFDAGSDVEAERSFYSSSTRPQVGSVIIPVDFSQIAVNSTTDDDVIDAAVVDSWTIVRISVSAFIAVSSFVANGLLLAAVTSRRRNRVDRKHRSPRDARSDLATVECGTTARTAHVNRTVDGFHRPTSLKVVGDRRDAVMSSSVIVHLQSTAAAGVTSGILSAVVCAVTIMTAASSTSSSYFACHPAIRSTIEGFAAGIPTVCLYGHIAALIDRHLALSLRPHARYQHLVGGYCRAHLVAAVVWLYSVLVAAVSALRRAETTWELRRCGPTIGGLLLNEGSGLIGRRFTIISSAAGFVVSFMIVFSVVYQRCKICKRNRKSTIVDPDCGDLPDRKRFQRVTNRCRLDVAVIVAHVTGVALWSADVFLRNAGLVGSDAIRVIGSSRDAEIVQQMALLCGLTVGVCTPCVYLTVGTARL